LAGKSTLNRLELGTGVKDRYKKIVFRQKAVDELLVSVFIESHEQAPAEIVLDMDTTDLPLHGKQEGRFFHGYYDNYCYLPLYVFCGDHVLCARLREANHDAAFGCLPEIERIVKQIRTAWPAVKIVLRGDSGFCRNQLMSWCESHDVDYLFGMARNKRLRKIIGKQMHEATMQWKQTGKPARVFTQFQHSTKKTKKSGWGRERRVAAKAEHIDGKENPRFKENPRLVVTSLTDEDGRHRHCTKNSIAAVAIERTGSKSSSVCSPTGSAPKPCEPTSCVCICQPRHIFWSAAYAVWG
jgi:hypothetical protein